MRCNATSTMKPLASAALLAFHLALVSTLSGCTGGTTAQTQPGASPQPATSEALQGPSQNEMFAPFRGQWKLESRTFDPPLERNTPLVGSDLHIDGHVIQLGSGTTTLRLCQTRKVDGGIEGDAYRVDTDEPGEVQRFECKLRIVDDKLEYRFRAVDDNPSVNDPIIASPDYVPPTRPLTPDAPWWIETYSKIAG